MAHDEPKITTTNENTEQNDSVNGEVQTNGTTEVEEAADETVIKPTAEALEKLEEEAKLREEEEKERLNNENNEDNKTEVTKDAVVREVEEDENYDD